MNSGSLFFFALFVCAICATPSSFSASFSYWYPSIPERGKNKGVMYYSKTSDAILKLMSYENGFQELYNYTNGTLFRFDGKSCDSVFIGEVTDELVSNITDDGCMSSNTTNPVQICIEKEKLTRVQYSDGKIVSFTDVETILESDEHLYPTDWKCTATRSDAPKDIMWIVDRSVDSATSFAAITAFMNRVTSSFVHSEENGQTAIVTFGTEASLDLKLESNVKNVEKTINALVVGDDEFTCIGCGVTVAAELLEKSPRPVDKIAIVILGGKNTRPVDGRSANFTASVERLKKVATVISIGVSNTIDENELNTLATADQKIRTIFPLGSTTALSGALEGVVSSMCGKDASTVRCGGALCGVGNTPICPTTCPNQNGGCSVGSCKAAGLCSYTEIKCTDNNGCTTDKCSNGLCKHEKISCNEHETTHQGLCFAEEDDGYHCGYTVINSTCEKDSDCPQQDDKCLISYCSDGECKVQPKVPKRISPCYINKCEDGVLYQVPKDCDDDNACTEDSCDERTGQCVHKSLCVSPSPCQAATCDPVVGCSLRPIECPDLVGDDAPCYRVYCHEKKGCVKEGIRNARKKDGQKCFNEHENVWITLLVIYSIFAFGAIVVIVVLVCLWRRQCGMRRLLKMERRSRLNEVKENELYQAGFGGGENPFYEG